MTGVILAGRFLSASPSTIVVLEPAPPARNPLRPPPPAFHHGALASGLLPRTSRWLLSSRTYRDEPISAVAVLPVPRVAGMPSRQPMRAFEPLRDPSHAPSTILFLGGAAMFLASFLLGMLSAAPRQPDLPPPGQNAAPVLPALITSPCFPVTQRTAS